MPSLATDVRLPDALWEIFRWVGGCLRGRSGQHQERAAEGLRRCGSDALFRHTAARWMYKAGAPPWEVAVQLGHSVGKEYAVTRAVRLLQP